MKLKNPATFFLNDTPYLLAWIDRAVAQQREQRPSARGGGRLSRSRYLKEATIERLARDLGVPAETIRTTPPPT